jgi:hypothetical protein
MFTQSFHHPSKNLADRLYTAEFDDALVDQAFWKNTRYVGCKLKSKVLNKFTQEERGTKKGIGHSSIVMAGKRLGEMIIGGTGRHGFTVGGFFASTQTSTPTVSGLPGIFRINDFTTKVTWEGDSINPIGTANIKNETVALYISNTVIGGKEDPQFADIKDHSYIGINKILLINPTTDATQVLTKEAEDYTPFQRFVTNDLPTGGSFTVKLIDESIANSLKGTNQYKVKMNKGWLLKSFDFKHAPSLPQMTENNSMYLYKKGNVEHSYYTEGNIQSVTKIENDDRLRFRYGTIEVWENDGTAKRGGYLQRSTIGPSFGSSSIMENRFTQEYYSGSYGFINEPGFGGIAGNNSNLLGGSGLGSASRFIGQDTLEYLERHNISASIDQEKTELYITFVEGTKNFAPGFNDERSISTFEVDKNQNKSNLGSKCQDFLPNTHELFLKGVNDSRFNAQINEVPDHFINSYLVTHSVTSECIAINDRTPEIENANVVQLGINADKTLSASIYIQAGYLGPVGYGGAASSSKVVTVNPPPNGTVVEVPKYSLSGSMTSENYFSGSFSYQLSFLSKDPTIITNLSKNNELFNGIGNNGIVIIPENIHPKIKNNVNFYLQQAGLIDSSPNTLTYLADDTK